MKENKPLKIPYYYQNKITIVSFVLVIMMLYVHGIYNESELFRMSYIVKSIISRLSYRVINPTYFSISGFLFFYGINAMADCFPKMKKRIHTVLIPFILWNLIVVLENLIFYQIPFSSEFFNFNLLDKYNDISAVIYNLLICPAGFHLWFLRDLIEYIVISPIIYLLIKKFSWYLPVILLVLTPPLMHFFNLEHLDIAFFALGGTIAMKSDLQSVKAFLSKRIVVISAVVYLGLSFTWDFFLPNHFSGDEYLSILFSVCGMITIWRGYDGLSQITNFENNHLLLTLTNYSFFIYLFHEPIFFVIMQLGTSIFGFSSTSLSLLYIINPALLIILAIIVAKIIKTIVPSFYSVLTGGRIARFQSK